MRTCTLYWRHVHARSASNQADLEVMEASKQVPKVPPRCVVSLVGSQHVTVNNGSLNKVSKPNGRQVIVTPLATPSVRPLLPTTLHQELHGRILPVPSALTTSRVPLATTQQRSQGQLSEGVSVPTLTHVLLKAVLKGGNKDGKTFTIRDVDTAAISSCDDMKMLIREQLSEDIVTEDFDIGFVNGSSVIRIRNKEDLSDVWAALRKPGNKMTLWCDGLVERRANSRKRVQGEDVDSDREVTQARPPKKKQADREDKVQETVDNLKETHSSRYTPMQLRIWAEMIVSGMHSSIEDPPNTTMFVRAGGGTPYKKKDQKVPVAQALTDAVTAIASALSPRLGSSGVVSGMGTSPAKVIESRSKLYKQLSELQNLESSGVLTDEEYKSEKESIMNLLQQLKTNK